MTYFDYDEDERREAAMQRRQSFNGCKCGNPDWPGHCPGWRNCPLQQHEEPDEEKD